MEDLHNRIIHELNEQGFSAQLKDKDIKLSKIAYGLPVGADLAFADNKTLEVALKNRTKVKKEEEL